MSVFLGDMLSDLLDQLERGEPRTTKRGGQLDLGAHTLPQIPRHSGDRNRTSPFAFTGNKFEFRAIGSSSSIAWPNTVLNTIIAESLDEMATDLEKRAGSKPAPEKLQQAAIETLKEIVRAHRRVVFDGDNYDPKWHQEAAKRGLPHLRTTPDALPVLSSAKARDLFAKYGVLSERELAARVEVLWETYNNVKTIEARTMAAMLRQSVLPAGLRYQTELSRTVAAAQQAGADFEDTWGQLTGVVKMVEELRKAIEALEKAEAEHDEHLERHAIHIRDRVVPAMVRAREASDSLEAVIPADLWPLPTYTEMLFQR
jgi:glutamine synthetase